MIARGQAIAPRFVNTQGAAAFLGMSADWLVSCREGKLQGPPYVKVGPGRAGAVRYDTVQLAEWMRSRTIGTRRA